LLFIVKTNGVEGPRQRTVQNTPGNHLNRQQTPPREILARPCVHAKLSVGQVVERDAEINNDYKEFCSIPKKIQIDHARSPSRPVYSERNIKMLNYTLNRYSLSNNFSTPSLFRGSEFKEKEEVSDFDHLYNSNYPFSFSVILARLLKITFTDCKAFNLNFNTNFRRFT